MIEQLKFLLQSSRPGLWFATVWMYLLPTSQMDIWTSTNFYIGLIYVTFPLNLMVYGWNDIYDQDTDLHNPRKGNYWFGAKGTPQQLQSIFYYIFSIQVLFYIYFIYQFGSIMITLLLGFMAISAVYNWPQHGLKSKPPFELLCQIGYLLIVPLGVIINRTANVSTWTYVYLLLFAIQSHLMGEVMDIIPDRKSGRRTTATVLGILNTKALIIGIVISEITLLMLVFKDIPFTAMMLGALFWLLADLLFIFKQKTYTLGQMKFFGLSSNLIAIASMGYMWYSGCLLLHP